MADYRKVFAPFILGDSPKENGDWDAYCPAHEDPGTSKKPSAYINFDARAGNGIWHCFVCKPSGRDAYLSGLARMLRERKADGWSPGSGHIEGGAQIYRFKSFQRGGGEPSADGAPEKKEPRKLPSVATMRSWTDNLAETSKGSWLADNRGIPLAFAEEFGIGWYPTWQRYAIPVRNADGHLLNIRMYKPRAVENKMIWYREGGGQLLFGFDRIRPEDVEVILFEGETDTLLAMSDGLAAVTHTAGAATFLPGWAKDFTNKVVFICYDNDKAGRDGRETAARNLMPTVRAIYFVNLPKDGSDYTDFRIRDGHSVGDFRELLEEAKLEPRYVRREKGALAETGEIVTVEESQNSDRNGSPVELAVSITGKTEPAYSIPRQVVFNCDQKKGKTQCGPCPMHTLYNGQKAREYEADHTLINRAIDVTDEKLKKMLKDDIGARCIDHLQVDVDSFWSVEHLVVTDSIERQRELSGMPVTRDVYNVGTYASQVNTTARVVGQQIPDPRSQRGLFTSWLLEPVQTSIDHFEITADLLAELAIFRPEEGESPLEKCYSIAEDLAANVTSIFGRPELHIAYDLVWHSVLSLSLLGRPIDKGWLEMAVIGDSRTGKSEVAKNLSRHYSAGVIYSCDQASLAGLVGGVSQPTGKHWHVSWGAIPLQDRRLVVLDEAQSLVDKGIIEHMSSIRSSGIAQINKIRQAQTNARTRLIWIANPPSGSQISSLPDGGMDGIRQLMPQHEDVARFDFAMAAARDEVPSELINSVTHEVVEHRFKAEVSAALVTWAWSRKPEQILWARETEDYLLKVARLLGSRYSSDFPLVQAENVRMKIARISAALAARTFSSNKAGDCLIIRRAHVRDAVRFLSTLYDSDIFGYGRLSARTIRDSDAAMSNVERARAYFSGRAKRPDGNGRVVAKALRSVGGRFDLRNFAEAATLSLDEVGAVVRWLEDLRLVRRTRGGRYIEPARPLVDLLKSIEDAEVRAAEEKAEADSA